MGVCISDGMQRMVWRTSWSVLQFIVRSVVMMGSAKGVAFCARKPLANPKLLMQVIMGLLVILTGHLVCWCARPEF